MNSNVRSSEKVSVLSVSNGPVPDQRCSLNIALFDSQHSSARLS